MVEQSSDNPYANDNSGYQQQFDQNSYNQGYDQQNYNYDQYQPQNTQQQNMGGDQNGYDKFLSGAQNAFNQGQGNSSQVTNHGAADVIPTNDAGLPLDPSKLNVMYMPQNEGHMELEVGEPTLIKGTLGDFHEYPITGRDSLGAIEIQRRFSNFVDFHKCLTERFPGLFIPPIPPKASDKKKGDTLEERRYFLNLFLKECCSLPYIVSGIEMQTFVRPVGELQKALGKLLRTRPLELLQTYRATLKVPEDYEDFQVKQFTEEINTFVKDQEAMLKTLLQFKGQLKIIVPLEEQRAVYYKDFAKFIETYEETKDKANLVPNALSHVRLLSGPKGNYLKEKMELMCMRQTNPVKHIQNWVKGEVWCATAMIMCKAKLDYIDQLRQRTIKEIADTQDTINKLNAGKFTFGGIFKNDAEKKGQAIAKMNIKTELEKDVECYVALQRILKAYIATVAIPNYKKQRTEAYIRAMGWMCRDEMTNADVTLDCWSNFKTVIDQFRIY